jgi:hypothetical protein
VRQIGPQKAGHVGQRGRAADEGDGKVQMLARYRSGEAALDEHRCRGAFDQPQGAAGQQPGQQLAPVQRHSELTWIAIAHTESRRTLDG